MTRPLIASLLVLTTFSLFAQDLGFEIRGTYARSVQEEKLDNATTMSDLIDGYPVSWIADYISAEVTVVSGNKVVHAIHINDTLTIAQRDLLKSASLGDDIVLDITYRAKNFITKDFDVRVLHYTTSIIPEHEAEFPGGLEPMTQYLEKNAMKKIPESALKEFQQVIVSFTVNENGEIANARLSSTSGDQKTDELLLKAITQMPKWKPAEIGTGTKVKQEFEFSVGYRGC